MKSGILKWPDSCPAAPSIATKLGNRRVLRTCKAVLKQQPVSVNLMLIETGAALLLLISCSHALYTDTAIVPVAYEAAELPANGTEDFERLLGKDKWGQPRLGTARWGTARWNRENWQAFGKHTDGCGRALPDNWGRPSAPNLRMKCVAVKDIEFQKVRTHYGIDEDYTALQRDFDPNSFRGGSGKSGSLMAFPMGMVVKQTGEGFDMEGDSKTLDDNTVAFTQHHIEGGKYTLVGRIYAHLRCHDNGAPACENADAIKASNFKMIVMNNFRPVPEDIGREKGLETIERSHVLYEATRVRASSTIVRGG